MDEEWDDDELLRAVEEFEAERAMGIPLTTFRATITGSVIRLVKSDPALADAASPLGSMLEEVADDGVTIADLGDSGDPQSGMELTVTYLAEGDPDAEETLAEWATLIGYRRVWFPDGVVELGRRPAFVDKASVSCPACEQTWTAGGREFWLEVMDRRAFPTFCPLCGGGLPQWTLLPRASYMTDCQPLLRPDVEAA